ncbi:Xylose isomerase-like TIM barrel [Posidoniimonas polymericola]|uniref:Xylose isomerase-like TIM barrel n=1 Tax=Posidoniimonas polymericola TaxID=2528002 RepID=A0A5C5YU32_9BACT|nr:sugar phosphate isomerase/epimerase family protein [Posidoniimonas polymericola]TWT78495.1 Xylose isomerase-like TIM barrel [Posidoniimonas polymericola]
MPAVRIGVVTSSLRRPLRSALLSASQSGADGVEVDLRTELPTADLSESAVRQLRKLLEDLRLTVGAAAFPTRRGFGDPRELDRRIAATQAAMAAARKLGARVVVLRLGEPPAADDPQRPLLEDSLQALSRHADHIGVRIALQASGDQLETLAGLLDTLPNHLLGVSLDPAGLIAEGVDIKQAFDAIGRRLSHVYAADAVRDLSTRGAVPVELGRGSVEWPEALGRLEEHDYRDWLFVKLREGAGPDELENAVAYLRAV